MKDKLWLFDRYQNKTTKITRVASINKLRVTLLEGDNVEECAKSYMNKTPKYHYLIDPKGEVVLSLSHAFCIRENNEPLIDCSRRVEVAILIPRWMKEWATDYEARFLAYLCYVCDIETVWITGDKKYRDGVYRFENRIKDMLQDKEYLKRWGKECWIL